MTQHDRLYTETQKRVGRVEMFGIDSLLAAGHTGIAERHTVQKLLTYIESLETQLEITVPELQPAGMIKVVNGSTVSYLQRTA